ncbi:MAG: outer membrane beta-barrel protein [Crocinitomicaceae bacterium]|nr:outer membrane beta-barrel protein [Crocinitomicaceae bacterium]
MKKIIFTVGVLLASYGASAQGFYGDFNVGYGLGLPNYVMGTTRTVTLSPTLVTTDVKDENIYGSIGQGFNLALTPGYMINEHIGIELGFNYFMGAQKTIQETKTNNASIHSTRKAQSNQLRLIPSVVVSSGGDKISVYAKGGLVLPVMGVTNIEIDGSELVMTGGGLMTKTTHVESEFKGKVSLGFRGTLGVDYLINDRLSMFGELQQTNLFIKQDKNTIVAYKVNGVDVLGTFTGDQKETIYVDEINSQSKPNEALAGKTNFNQFGINVGVKYRF